MFRGLINDFKAAAASFLGTYLARASVAVPFLVALGFATSAIALELTERFGARNALWILAGGFCAIGLLAAFAVTLKEQEMTAEEETQQRNEGGIAEMTSSAATQAAGHLPAALLGALLQNPSATAVPVARMVGRHMPLLMLLLLLAVLFWPTEEETADHDEASTAPEPEAQVPPLSPEEAALREAA